MMSTAFEGQKLRTGFTFRVVEEVKRIRIHPTPRMTGLPWGLSVAAGIILAVLGLNPRMSLTDPSSFVMSSPLPVEMKVLKIGEIPVDVLNVSHTPFIASKQGAGGGGKHRPADDRGDFLLAPQASEVKLKPGDGAAGDNFGGSVAIHGDYAIVGASGKDDKKGAAYIFKRDGDSWKEQEMLRAGDGAKEDGFGWAVAISDEFVFVGAPWDDDKGENTGSVYIFHRTGETWAQQAKLNPHGQPIKGCSFGQSIAISGDYLVVGSPREEWAGGAIYIFKRDGDVWKEQAKLVSSNRARQDYFGDAVSISGDYVIATAPKYAKLIASGSAYIFKRDGDAWKEEQAILTAEDGKADDRFGASVSISGDYAIVGAYGAGGGWRGAAYIFVREGTFWRQQVKIVPDDLVAGDCFGARVFISGDRAIVSSSYKAGGKGAIYGFMRDGVSWKQVSKQTASDGMVGDKFFVVAFSGNYAIVGAWAADVSGADSGAAYIYHCAADLSFPSLPVEPSGFSATTFGGEKNKPAIPDVGAYCNTPLPSVPKEYRLLQNYPNPFNPETWIPYQLAEDMDVTISIYNVSGQLVRALSPGRKPPGVYTTKEKAACWDGRDSSGGKVASGVYFYTIRAGDFIDTKKMVIAK